MREEYISLKSYSSNRLSQAWSPSARDKIYSIKDFKSPGFLEKLFSYHPIAEQDYEPKNISETLLSFVENIDNKFRNLKQHLDSVKEEYITRGVALLTFENKKEELKAIKLEMTKCHTRLVENGLDPLLVEDFARLYSEYNSLQRNNDFSVREESVEKLINLIDGNISDVKAVIRKYHEALSEELPPPMSKRMKIKDISHGRQGDSPQDKVIPLYNRKIFDLKAKLFEWNSQDHALLISTKSDDLTWRSWRSSCDILNLKTGRVCQSIKLQDRQPKLLLTFRFFDSKNLVVIPDYHHKILQVYHINSRKIRLIATLPIESIFPNSVFHDEKFIFEVLNSQNIIAIAYGHHLKLINIFTRKVLFEEVEDHYGPIFSIIYMKDLKLLVVGMSPNMVKIFSILGTRGCLSLKHSLKIGSKAGTLIGMYLFSNSLIIVEWTGTIHLHRIQFKLQEIKQDSINTNITINQTNYLVTHTISNQIRLNYGMRPTTCDDIACHGVRTYYTSPEKINETEIFEKTAIMGLYEDQDRAVQYDTKTNSIVFTQKQK